jgi:hypothetical protein
VSKKKKINPNFTEQSLAVCNVAEGEFILVTPTRKRGISYYKLKIRFSFI